MTQFQFTQDYQVYQAKQEGVYPIKETDWDRLKRMIESIIPHKRIFQMLYSIAIGIFGSSIFSLITIYIVDSAPNWAILTNWIITLVSLICGVGLMILDNQQKDIVSKSSDEVISEMTLIENAFEKPKGD
jgi:hypothetical protein